MSYINTFITTAPDSIAEQAGFPENYRDKKPLHQIHFELLTEHPYTYDHYELIFETYLIKENLQDLSKDEKQTLWEQLFSKGHPCLRASALTKKYGYGAHYNENGKIALVPIESEKYQAFQLNEQVTKIPAMRTKREKK